MRWGEGAPAVRELVKLADEVALAIELLKAYDRGDRRACLRAWDTLWRAEARLDAARDQVRTLNVE
jgi:hypothetical protein